jgi:hypothetical protein
MKKAFLRGFAVVAVALFANVASAGTNSSIVSTIEPGIATVKPLVAAANGAPMDVVIINYTDPNDKIFVTVVSPKAMKPFGSKFSGRFYADNWGSDKVQVVFTYGANTFNDSVPRRSTIEVRSPNEKPTVTPYS